MDETSSAFPSHDELARLLPGYLLDSTPLNTTNMSLVYLASDPRVYHRKVAVKIMAGYLAEHPVYRKRFLREIQLMASLEHPNIMYVIAAAEEDDQLLYLVMPRAQHDLRALLAKGPLELSTTAHTINQVARALDFAHDHGVVHRDVKPGNILFGQGAHVYLSDFGVAKEHFGEDLTSIGETIGTRRYTAPEVFDTRSGDAPVTDENRAARMLPCTPRERSGDVYSLGAVIHHCLTGRRPFDHADDSAANAAQRRGDLTPVTTLRPGAPTAIDEVVAKAMHLEPDQRYSSCGEVAAAVTQALGLAGDGPALIILRDIQDRLRSGSAEIDSSTPSPEAVPPSGSKSRGDSAGRLRIRLLTILTVAISVAMLGGLLLYQLVRPDEEPGNAAGDSSGGDVTWWSATVPPTANLEPPSPTVDPVTGDAQAERRPVEGECVTDHPDEWIVVACDSPLAAELIFKIVISPEDPNPKQPEHDDAAWEACSGEGHDFDYEWYWSDSLDEDETDREWDPEIDRIRYIMCYVEI